MKTERVKKAVAVAVALIIILAAVLTVICVLATRNKSNGLAVTPTEESDGLKLNVESSAASNLIGTATVTATVTPAGFELIWTLGWENPSDTRNIDDYLSLVKLSNEQVQITCLKRFTGTARLEVRAKGISTLRATADITAPKGVTSLKIATAGEFGGSYHPLYPECEAAFNIIDLTQLPLVNYNADGSFDTTDCLAESATVSNGGLTVTFNIRSGIKTHENTPVTAADAAYTLYYLCHPQYDGYYDLSEYIYDAWGYKHRYTMNIGGISYTDNSLTVGLTAPIYTEIFDVPIMINNVGWSAGSNISEVTKDNYNPADKAHLGAYMLMGLPYEGENITLYKNESYYNADAYAFETITVMTQGGFDEKASAFDSGSIDVYTADMYDMNAKYALSSNSAVTIGNRFNGFMYAELNPETVEFGLRKSFAYLIAGSVAQCADEPVTYRSFYPFSSTQLNKTQLGGFQTEYEGVTSPNEGISEFNNSGFSASDLPTYRLLCPTAWQAIGEAVQAAFADAGITVDINALPMSEYLTAKANKEYDVIICEKQSKRYMETEREFADTDNDQIMQALQSVEGMTNTQEIYAAFMEIYTTAINDYLAVPMLERTEVMLVSNKVTLPQPVLFNSWLKYISAVQVAE